MCIKITLWVKTSAPLKQRHIRVWWHIYTMIYLYDESQHGKIYADNAHFRIASCMSVFVNSRQKLCLTSELSLLVAVFFFVFFASYISNREVSHTAEKVTVGYVFSECVRGKMPFTKRKMLSKYLHERKRNIAKACEQQQKNTQKNVCQVWGRW